MPSALSFRNEDEIIAALEGRRWEDDLEKLHREFGEDLGPLTAVYKSVAGNTYRPFRKQGKYSPSGVFRSWALAELFDGAFARLCKVKSNRQSRAWARRLAGHLGKK